MKSSISYTALALALALAAGSTAANAQTVITRQISEQPVETVITQSPVQTVQTTTTVRTVRPAARRSVVTTRRTTVTQRILPAQTVSTFAANPAPLYDVVPGAAPMMPPPAPAPLYDVAAPVVDETVFAPPPAPVFTPVPVYRYVYEPDRILVIDPNTGIAIQALPR